MRTIKDKTAWIDIDDTVALTWPEMFRCAMSYCERNHLNLQPDYFVKSVDDLYIMDIFHFQDEDLSGFFEEYYPEYLTRIEPIPGAKQFLDELRSHSFKINFISARRNKWGQVENITRAWLDKNTLPYDQLFINCKDKAKYLRDKTGFFIDDSYINCTAVAKQTSLHVIQKRCLFSKKAAVFQGKSWYQILDHLLSLTSDQQR